MSASASARREAALGADIEGVDLSRPLDDAVFAAIEQAWMAHQVLRFRGQRLDEDKLTAFSERFGRLDKAPVRAANVREYQNPYVLIVSNIVENGQAIGSLGNYEAQWHIDMSYLDEPPIGSILYAVEVPPRAARPASATSIAPTRPCRATSRRPSKAGSAPTMPPTTVRASSGRASSP